MPARTRPRDYANDMALIELGTKGAAGAWRATGHHPMTVTVVSGVGNIGALATNVQAHEHLPRASPDAGRDRGRDPIILPGVGGTTTR